MGTGMVMEESERARRGVAAAVVLELELEESWREKARRRSPLPTTP